MSEAGKVVDIDSEGLIAPTIADFVVDPASLEPLAGDASLAQGASSGIGEALVLSLEDLLPDVEGAVVMLSDDSLPVSLVTAEPLAGSGIVDEPVSAGGLDVEGLHFYSFANGLTLYSDTDILIVSETAGA